MSFLRAQRHARSTRLAVSVFSEFIIQTYRSEEEKEKNTQRSAFVIAGHCGERGTQDSKQRWWKGEGRFKSLGVEQRQTTRAIFRGGRMQAGVGKTRF